MVDMQMTLDGRVRNLATTFKKNTIGNIAGISEPEISRLLRRGEVALSAAKLTRLQTACDKLEFFAEHILPQLNSMLAPLKIDCGDVRGITNFIQHDMTDALAALEFGMELKGMK